MTGKTGEQRHGFVKLGIRNGEYEYTANSTHLIPEGVEVDALAENHAKTFYGGESEKDGDNYYFHGGCVAVWVVNYREISKEEYETLRGFGM